MSSDIGVLACACTDGGEAANESRLCASHRRSSVRAAGSPTVAKPHAFTRQRLGAKPTFFLEGAIFLDGSPLVGDQDSALDETEAAAQMKRAMSLGRKREQNHAQPGGSERARLYL